VSGPQPGGALQTPQSVLQVVPAAHSELERQGGGGGSGTPPPGVAPVPPEGGGVFPASRILSTTTSHPTTLTHTTSQAKTERR
jgi:hypothetical protein